MHFLGKKGGLYGCIHRSRSLAAHNSDVSLMILLYNFHSAYMTADKRPTCKFAKTKRKIEKEKNECHQLNVWIHYITYEKTGIYDRKDHH